MFALFEWDTYYPAGGWNDHVATMETVDRARAWMHRDVSRRDGHHPASNAQIVDLASGAVVEQWERQYRYAGTHPPGLSAPKNWTYPEDEHGRIYWHVEQWELST